MFQLVKALFRRTARRPALTARLSVEALETRATPAASPWIDPEIRPIGHIDPTIRPIDHVSILLPSLKPNDRLGILLPSLRPVGYISPELRPVGHINPEWLK